MRRYRATHNPHPIPAQGYVVSHSTATPDETPVKPTAPYTVAADEPKRISIPTIHAEGLVQAVSIDQHNAVAVPSNVHFAGWYIHNAKPGDPGVGLLVGHVQGIYEPGIFKDLGKLQPGDTFTVTMGDDTERHFSVISRRDYTADEATKHMLDRDPTMPRQLNLITCSGRYNKATKQYDHRTLVVAKYTN